MLSLFCGHAEAKVAEAVALGTAEVAGKLTAFIGAAGTASMGGELLNGLG